MVFVDYRTFSRIFLVGLLVLRVFLEFNGFPSCGWHFMRSRWMFVSWFVSVSCFGYGFGLVSVVFVGV